MKTIALRTAEGRFIAHEVRIACSLRERLFALSRVRSLPTRAGLLLSPARAVHTLGMRFPVDVVFLSRQMRVLGLAPRVAPWRVVLAPHGTGRVLQIAAGQIAATGLTTGKFLLVESNDAERQPLPIAFSLRLPLSQDAVRPHANTCSRTRTRIPPRAQACDE